MAIIIFFLAHRYIRLKMNDFKDLVKCKVCQMTLNDPVFLPCYCTCCGDHLNLDDTYCHDGVIQCIEHHNFNVRKLKRVEDRLTRKILANRLHLSEEEKIIGDKLLKTIKSLNIADN